MSSAEPLCLNFAPPACSGKWLLCSCKREHALRPRPKAVVLLSSEAAMCDRWGVGGASSKHGHPPSSLLASSGTHTCACSMAKRSSSRVRRSVSLYDAKRKIFASSYDVTCFCATHYEERSENGEYCTVLAARFGGESVLAQYSVILARSRVPTSTYNTRKPKSAKKYSTVLASARMASTVRYSKRPPNRVPQS